MRVSTLIRQLDDLNKHHSTAGLSIVTPRAWYQEQQVLGLWYDTDNGLVVLYQRALAKERTGFRAFELSRMLNSSADPIWRVLVELGTDGRHEVIGVTLHRDNGQQRSATFLNDAGEPARVTVSNDGKFTITTTASIPLALVDLAYDRTADAAEALIPLALYEAVRDLRALVYDSLGLQP
jgi:hypothetical protein